MANSPGERLKQLRENVGLDQKGFAAKLGVSPGVLGFVERNQRRPSKKLLEKLFDSMGVSSDWLLNGVGEMFIPTDEELAAVSETVKATREFWSSQRLHDADYGLLSFYQGERRDELIASDLAFKLSWIEKLGVEPEHLKLTHAPDDRMEPIIAEGDLIMLDTSNAKNLLGRDDVDPDLEGQTFMITVDEDPRLQRVEFPNDHSIVIYSENARNYPPEVYSDGELDMVRIVGRVVWWSHTVE